MKKAKSSALFNDDQDSSNPKSEGIESSVLMDGAEEGEPIKQTRRRVTKASCSQMVVSTSAQVLIDETEFTDGEGKRFRVGYEKVTPQQESRCGRRRLPLRCLRCFLQVQIGFRPTRYRQGPHREDGCLAILDIGSWIHLDLSQCRRIEAYFDINYLSICSLFTSPDLSSNACALRRSRTACERAGGAGVFGPRPTLRPLPPPERMELRPGPKRGGGRDWRYGKEGRERVGGYGKERREGEGEEMRGGEGGEEREREGGEEVGRDEVADDIDMAEMA